MDVNNGQFTKPIDTGTEKTSILVELTKSEVIEEVNRGG